MENNPLNISYYFKTDVVEMETKNSIEQIIQLIKVYYFSKQEYGGIVTYTWSIPFPNFSYFQYKVLTSVQNAQLLGNQNRNDQIHENQNQNVPIVAQNPIIQRNILNFSLSKRLGYVKLNTELNLHQDEDKKIFQVLIYQIKDHDSKLKNETRLIPISFLKSCVEILKTKHPRFEFERSQDLVVLQDDYVTIPAPKAKAIKSYSIKQELYNKLKPHQKNCVTKGVELNGRILIADEAGLGKTFSSLALADVYRHAWPLLIICPSFLRKQWATEIKKWLDIDETKIQIIDDGSVDISKKRIVIVSYKLCIPLKEKLLAKQFRICIFDESQTLKQQNKQTEACQSIIDKAQYVLFLTGTPIMSQTFELYSQIKFLNGQKLDGFYVISETNPHINDAFDIRNNDDFLAFIRNYCMQRTTKKEVDLPHLTRYLIQVPTDPNFVPNIFNKNKCQKESGKAKLNGVLQVVENFLKKNEKIVFFAFYKEILDAVKQKCDLMQYNSIVIKGNRTEEERNQDIDNFQKDQNIRIAILSYKCASIGISLTAATTVILGELYYEEQSRMIQAESRVYRLGQLKNVNCYYLIGKNELQQFQKMKQKYVGFTKDLSETEEEFEIFEMPFSMIDKPMHQIRQHTLRLQNNLTKNVQKTSIYEKIKNEFNKFHNRVTRSQTRRMLLEQDNQVERTGCQKPQQHQQQQQQRQQQQQQGNQQIQKKENKQQKYQNKQEQVVEQQFEN